MGISTLQGWLGFSITVFGLVAVLVRLFDTAIKASKMTGALDKRLSTEEEGRKASDRQLRESIVLERESRNSEYMKIQVELAKINTNISYVIKHIDKSEGNK